MATTPKKTVSSGAKRIKALPPIEAVRPERSLISTPTEQPYSFLQAIQYYTGTERDLIWGPFYKSFRAVRRQRANWEDFNLESIWKGIPAATQTRPGLIRRAINWATGADPPPTMTPQPPKAKARDSKAGDRTPRTPRTPLTPRKKTGYQSWQEAFPDADDWSPARIDFTAWHGRYKHPADYDDDFFRANYAVLYERVCDFAEKWFGADIYLEDWRDSKKAASVWEVPMTEQFVQYARVVAHEDRGYVGWDEILNDPRHRKWLCVGILSQIIERRIFDHLLFGAGKLFQEELDRHDLQWVFLEGFTRKEGRRQIARASLGEGLLPSDFWDAVDDLTGQTALIFQPLFTLMCLATGKLANRAGADFYQELHTILAMAGYFQVCMSISPSVFHILSATPGSRFQWEEEEHADKDVYNDSKAFHKSHEARWQIIAELSITNQMDEVHRLLRALDNFDEAALYMPFPPTDQDYRVMSHERQRGGKVMYAVFPKLTRYSAENVGELVVDPRRALAPEVQAEGEGTRISLLSRCKVVYYQGLVHPPDQGDDGVQLETYLAQLAWDRMPLGVLPYRQRYWAADGTATMGFAWPLWPEYIDKFWIFWVFSLVFSYVVMRVFGQPDTMAQKLIYAAFMIKSFDTLVVEAFVYLTLRASGMEFFQGPGLYLKIQSINVLFLVLLDVLLILRNRRIRVFQYMCVPFMWLDSVFIDKMPAFLMASAAALRGETPASLVKHAAGTVGSLFGRGAAS